MIKFIKNIGESYSILKNILKLTDKKIKILFFSESRFDQKFSYPLINFFSKKYPNQVYYVSSDINDKFENIEINNLYVGNGLLMGLFFSIIKVEYFFLTLTDLGNHSLKKNKNVNNYIYFFHTGSSTFQSFTKGAFDNYDVILCNGQYQIDEIRFREKQNNLPKKKLILTGHFYFDYMLKKINFNQKADEILIAPSWNYKYDNYINENVVKVINELINKNYKVTFRPHPEHYKRSKNTLKLINDKFQSYTNFRFDNDLDNIKSMEKAICLITDTSDICLEYSFLFNRPVLYLEGFNKIHNESYSDFKDFQPIEQQFKNKFGVIIFEKEISNIDHLIEETIKNFSSKITDLNSFKNQYYFNFGKSIDEFEKVWKNQLLNS